MHTTPDPTEVLAAMNAARVAGDYETALSYVSPTSLDQGSPFTHAQWRERWEAMRRSAPDLEIVVEQALLDGPWVAHRYSLRGTHSGDFLGQPPTGRRFELNGMDMVRIEAGLLVEHWAFIDAL